MRLLPKSLHHWLPAAAGRGTDHCMQLVQPSPHHQSRHRTISTNPTFRDLDLQDLDGVSRFLKLNPFQKIFVEAKVQKYISHEMSKVSLRQVRADSSEVVFTEHYIDLTSWTPTTHNTLLVFSMMIRLLRRSARCNENLTLIVILSTYWRIGNWSLRKYIPSISRTILNVSMFNRDCIEFSRKSNIWSQHNTCLNVAIGRNS